MADLVTLAAPMAGGLLGWFAETTLVASALAAVAALVARVPRIAPGPAARHALWLLVLLKLVTPPLVHWPWSVPVPWAATGPDSGPAAGGSGRPGGEGPRTGPGAVPGPFAGPPAGRDAPTVPPPVGGVRGAVGPDPGNPPISGTTWPGPGTGIASAWLVGSIALALLQARQVSRFGRILHDSRPAPGWLVEEAREVGRRLAVGVPPLRVVRGAGAPVLWCPGRPVLLVPAGLLQTLEAGRWRAIVAHELAHLRRGDHWVRRLELVAGLVWWWNPLYWLARDRLDFEAELACDAWAVWALPGEHLDYAESLLRICTGLSPSGSPAPALGVVGTGRSFERRLTMILRERVDRRVTAPALLIACLLGGLALPSWTMARPSRDEGVLAPTPATIGPATPGGAEPDVLDDEAVPQAVAPAAGKEKAAALRAEREKLREKLEALDRELAGKSGPGPDLAAEMEKKFGPGSDFATRMEALGREMEKKFGPGSDFAREMESLGAEMEKKFGPGSAFARALEEKFGPDGDPAARERRAPEGGEPGDARARARAARMRAEAKAKAAAEKAGSDARRPKSKAEANARPGAAGKDETTTGRRARRIEALESRLEGLKKELEQLKAESDGDEPGEQG